MRHVRARPDDALREGLRRRSHLRALHRCGRTVAEIAAWAAMSEAERLGVMAGLGERLARARSRAARGGRVAARARVR